MSTGAASVRVWQRHEIVLEAAFACGNCYTDVTVWVDLEGPGFSRRVYGFWDGGATFRVRVVATAPGVWTWRSGSETQGVPDADPGLSGRSGRFEAHPWSAGECAANPNRRGFLRASANGHGFTYADGTPFLMLGDTWWAVPSYRFPLRDETPDEAARTEAPEPHPGMSLQEMARYRKAQGFNTIAMLAAHPTWANDRWPPTVVMNDAARTVVRNAWRQAGTDSAKDMHNEGGRPFLFPGRVAGYEDIVPDFDRINPAYFQVLDRKIECLCGMGFVVFIEAARRDVSQVWKTYGGWPDSYARYVQYLYARCHADNTLLSPIHFDWDQYSIPSRDYNVPANQVVDRYGPPPFGNLVGTNSGPSTLTHFGDDAEARWRTFHQIGNWREHEHYWYLTEIWRTSPAHPAINGEPYYPGFPNDCPRADSPEAEANNRSGLYGSLLSGALGGVIYGVEGIWGADIEPEARYHMHESIRFRSGDQVRHLRTFAEAAGGRLHDLVPDHEHLTPSRSGRPDGYIGWAYFAMVPDASVALAYFERHCPDAHVRGLPHDAVYRARWFDPRDGVWGDAFTLATDPMGRARIAIPRPDLDWGLCLERQG